MNTPALYKQTSTGKTQVWRQEVDGARYRTISGQLDGKKTESAWTTAKAKNVGKSNETTPEEQATLEVAANYQKKLSQGGYHESIDEIRTRKFFQPMLAQKYEDYPMMEGETVWVQPKLDGVRCIATKDGLFTRQGKPIPGTPHVFDALKEFFIQNPDAVLDGELYSEDHSDNFNEIISLVRKKSNDPERRRLSREYIKYHVYDFPSVLGVFSDRFKALEKAADDGLFDYDDAIRLVQTVKVDDLNNLTAWFPEFMTLGYEGMIVRRDDTVYEQKRSKSLLKLKQFQDEEFKIVSIDEGKGNREGKAGFITYELPDGRTFKSGIKGSHEAATAMLANADEYVGGIGTVRFFERTPDGIPRFPVTVALYEGERDL